MLDEIVIHGGGYVGLTAAVHYAKQGVKVTIYDPDPKTVLGINSGAPRGGDFLNYLHDDLCKVIDTQYLKATSIFSNVVSCPVHSIAVPTEKDGEPYDAIVLASVYAILKASVCVKPLIIIESTLSPGVVDKILATANMLAGTDFNLAVCPRRDWFADKTKNLGNLQRVVGGVTPDCTARACQALAAVTPPELMMPTTYSVAELCKALENSLLHVQVMLAEEVALCLHDKDVAEALRLAGTHWRLAPLHLSFGTGGRCVPLGTKYLTLAMTEAGYNPLVSTAATKMDAAMRMCMAQQVARHMDTEEDQSLILGIGYRPDFRDAGNSPGLAIAEHLAENHFPVSICDPLWRPEELALFLKAAAVAFSPNPIFKIILLATAHTAFLDLPRDPSLWRAGQYVLDGTGAWKKYEHLFKEYGVEYHLIGEPGWIS